MLRRARESGEDYLELGNRHVTTFLAEMAALNWLAPDHFPRATQHVPQMLDLIGRLVANGHAYVAEGHVYFSVASWPTYGELSKLSREEMLPLALERGSRPEMPGRRDPLDFVLWQPSLPDEPAWESPWGPGRPGWHIECSAMSSAYLGNHFEIHGGGEDLAFPHHESEIAQSEAATGERPFVEWWMHAGMLRYEDEKMSKSLGNLVLVRDLLRSHGADAIRLYLVGHHYRSELAFHEADLAAAAVTAAQLRLAALVAEREPSPGPPAAPSGRVRERRERFLAAMDDDLDTPVAIGELVALASIALDADAPGERAEASRTVLDLGGRIVGLQLAATPSLPEVGEAVST
jgi:L-cysteine:1D-myo-inositol 2-amino-2-deoxy-alpha-D-glucopyranoside ligase